MNGQMQQVETYLGDLSKECNTRLLDKSTSNLRVWGGQVGATGARPSEVFE